MMPRVHRSAGLVVVSLLVMAAGQAPLPNDGCQSRDWHKSNTPVYPDTLDFSVYIDEDWQPFKLKWGEPKMCNIRCKSIDDRSCDDLLYSSCRADEFTKNDMKQTLEAKTGGSCLKLFNWMNCDCFSCDSWRSYFGCRKLNGRVPLAGLGAAGLSCKEGDDFLHGERCTPQCPTGTTTHRDPLVCYDHVFYDPAANGEFEISEPAYTPCYSDVPPNNSGTVQFLDVDMRPTVVSGVLTADIAQVQASHFRVYWGTGTSASDRAGDLIMSFNASYFKKASVKLTGVEVPEGVSHLLVFPSNVYGPSMQPWSTRVYDLSAPVKPQTVPFKVKRQSGSSLEEAWLVGGLTCQATEPQQMGQNSAVDPVIVRARGSAASSAALCQDIEVVPVAVTMSNMMKPYDLYKCGQQIAGCPHSSITQNLQVGQMFIIEIKGQVLADDDRLWFVRQGQGCGLAPATTRQSPQGVLASQFNESGMPVQLWRMTVEYAGEYQVCWGGFQSSYWVAEDARTLALKTLSVTACRGCPEPCQVCNDVVNTTSISTMSTSNSTASTSNSTVSSPNSNSTQSVQEFLMLRETIDMEPGAPLQDLSFDIAPDMSYMVIAYPSQQMVRLIDMASRTTLLQVGGCREEGCNPTETANCEYIFQEGDVPPPLAPKNSTGNGPMKPRSDTSTDCRDGESADVARLMYPVGVRIAPSGAFFLVVDAKAHRIRRIDVATWKMSVVAGWGQASNILFAGPGHLGGSYSGDGQAADHARLNNPYDVAISLEDEQVFLIADRLNHRVRKVSHGIITTVVGNGVAATDFGALGSVATNVSLKEPTGVSYIPNGNGAFIVSESGANRISWVDSCGTIRTLTPFYHGNTVLPQARMTLSGQEVWFSLGCNEDFNSASLYAGCQAKTTTCRTCQPWNAPEVQASLRKQMKNGSIISESLPDNFCRQPYGFDSAEWQPWCYTDLNGTREVCSPRLATDADVESASNLYKLRLPADLSCANPIGKAVRAEAAQVSSKIWRPGFPLTDEAFKHTSSIAMAHTGEVYVIAKDTWDLLILGYGTVKCSEGLLWDPATSSCICPPGYFHKSADLDSLCKADKVVCNICPVGHYCEDGLVKKACPHGQSTFRIVDKKAGDVCKAYESLIDGATCVDAERATSRTQCTCGHGYVVGLQSGICEPCPPGTLCPAGYYNTRPVILRNGYQAFSDGSGLLDVLECGKKYHCWHLSYTDSYRAAWKRNCDTSLLAELWLDCAAGRPFEESSTRAYDMSFESLHQISSTGCFGETQQYRCGRCNVGWVENTEGLCISCGKNSYKSLLWLFAWTYALARFHAFFNNPKQSKNLVAYMLTNAVASLADFLQQFDLMTVIDIDWPKMNLDFLQMFLKIFMPAVNFGVVPFTCMLGNAYQVRFLYYQFQPFIIFFLFAFLWMWCMITLPLRSRLPTTMSPRLETFLNAKNTRSRRCLKYTVQYTLDSFAGIKSFKLKKDQTLNTIGFFITATYVSIARCSLTAFQTVTPSVSIFKDNKWDNCQKFGICDRVLMRFPDVIAFESTEWLTMLPFAVISLATTTVFVFVSHAILVKNGPKYWCGSASFRARRRYFFAKYREDRYYFGLITMVKSILLNMTILGMTLFQPALEGWTVRARLHSLTVQLTFLINIAYVCCLVKLNPYKASENSMLEGALHVAVTMITVVAITRDARIADVGLAATFYVQVAILFAAIAFAVGVIIHKIVKANKIDAHNTKVTKIIGNQLKVHFARLLDLKSRTLLTVVKCMSVPEQRKVMAGLAPVVMALEEWMPEAHEMPEGHDFTPQPSIRRTISGRTRTSGDGQVSAEADFSRFSRVSAKGPEFEAALRKLSFLRWGRVKKSSIQTSQSQELPGGDGSSSCDATPVSSPIGQAALGDDEDPEAQASTDFHFAANMPQSLFRATPKNTGDIDSSSIPPAAGDDTSPSRPAPMLLGLGSEQGEKTLRFDVSV